MPQFSIENKLEAILFYKNEPVEIKKLASILGVGEKEIKEELKNLSGTLGNRGICLVMTESEVSLATAPEATDLIEQISKDDLRKEIGKAGLETLAIVLYGGAMSRREIDYIRGLNSTFILRNLCMRGLLEREQDPRDSRVWKYKSTISILAHLGLKSIEELPEFDTFKDKLPQDNGEV